MAFRMVRLAVLFAVVLLASVAIGQVRPKSTKLPTPPRVTAPEGKVATAEEVDFTRFRVVTQQGILAVFDADEEWDGRDEPLSQLAYWHDLASEQLFFFDQRLFTLDDVLQSIATMPRDLNIELADIFTERPDFAPIPEISTPGQWRPAIEFDVVSVMAGGIPAAAPEGEVSGLINPCVPIDCGPALMATGPLAAPVRGTPRDELFAMASRGTKCNCGGGGGGGCQGGCPNPDQCTVSFCQNNQCVNQPINCGNNLCLTYTCDPATGCHSEPKNCPAPDACTTGGCLEGTGECRDSSCGSGDCCLGVENNHCCSENYTCCEYYMGGTTQEHGCCPPQRPLCLDEQYCCSLEQAFLCGTTCCESAENCCNGDCKDSCYDVVCGATGWLPGPQCGETWCEFGQICCNGVCCGDGPCFAPKCYPSTGMCINYLRCDDGDDCTDQICTPGECGDYDCGEPTNRPDGSSCEDDGDLCTEDYCVNGQCTHPPKCVDESTAQSIRADRICCPDGHCCLANETCCGDGCCGTGDYCCSDLSGCCPSGFECCEEDCCGGSAICCNGACGVTECDLDAGPATVCPGHTVDVDVVAICQPTCSTMTMTAEVFESEYQQYATVSVSPSSVACGPAKHPVTLTISLLPDTPLGTMDVKITGRITNSQGIVVCEVTTTSTISVDLGAVLSISPGTIPAITAWPGMPPNVNRSVITVTWNPTDCEGQLEISELQPEGSYVPSDEGTLTRVDANTWYYDAFIEPQSELCPEPVRVWIAAMSGDTELDRRYVRVIPVHTYLTTGTGANFSMDYSFITWKYATVLATTGGVFTGGVTVSTDFEVYCGIWPFGTIAYACTNVGTKAVTFGTATFASTENQAASIIGHELVHASGVFSECTAYTWEFTQDASTGVFPCDAAYRGEVVQMFNCECNNICP